MIMNYSSTIYGQISLEKRLIMHFLLDLSNSVENYAPANTLSALNWTASAEIILFWDISQMLTFCLSCPIFQSYSRFGCFAKLNFLGIVVVVCSTRQHAVCYAITNPFVRHAGGSVENG